MSAGIDMVIYKVLASLSPEARLVPGHQPIFFEPMPIIGRYL